jgi:hypothetical protein
MYYIVKSYRNPKFLHSEEVYCKFHELSFIKPQCFHELKYTWKFNLRLFVIPDVEGSPKSAERNITATVGLVVHAAGRGQNSLLTRPFI